MKQMMDHVGHMFTVKDRTHWDMLVPGLMQ